MEIKVGYLSFVFLIFFASFDLYAQTRCPVGVQAGGAQCLPDDQERAPPRTTGEWIKTWGAIVGSVKGREGWSSNGKFTEEDARQDALKKCYSVGAEDCLVEMTYFNQCVAIADSISGGSSIVTGKDESVASSRALADCKNKYSSQCSVKFTECTDPFFRKY
ncbi:DUF4189 domain-containing protein [Xanthomonas theicola]|uniref:DUF4189 domain-containing protein n=1 Tax=Xanthomonas theicola TaxID=56464 RepID=A0A2S6Z2Y4_9XANT|nr:DUF4189 domain-containing protein [Xanthomonas theicola]PPT75185.1 hypothetical protein XthCFBP4691_19805 [Xanthomonas theicola]QNH24608.1 DUF4189 domain-containing protein [Xanthomonas theicola]